MTDQSKTPGAMVLVYSSDLHRIADKMKFNCPNLSVELEQIVAASAEQTPAVGGEPLLHINPAVLAEVRGEAKPTPGGLTFSGSKPVGGWTVPLYEKHTFAPLLAEIERLKAENVALRTAGEVVAGAIPRLDAARARIAELKAEQGEPVAWLNEETGHVTTSPVVVMDWDDEKERVQSLYRAKPATAKVDMQSVMDAFQQANSSAHMVGTSNWCALMAEKLNGMKP